jgi:hypothetical protein
VLSIDQSAPTDRDTAASQTAVTVATTTEAIVPTRGSPKPQATAETYAMTASTTMIPHAHLDSPALARSRAARTSKPKITCAWVRKNPRGTERHEVSKIVTARPNARRIAKSASIGARIIKTAHALALAPGLLQIQPLKPGVKPYHDMPAEPGATRDSRVWHREGYGRIIGALIFRDPTRRQKTGNDVDAEGKLCSVEARGELEEMIPEMLAKKAKLTSARTGVNQIG